MSGVQARESLLKNCYGFIERQLPTFPDATVEIDALDKLHGHEFGAFGDKDVEYANDVAMGDLTREDQFVLEAQDQFGTAGKFGPNDLQGNGAVEFDVQGLIYGAHSALTQKLQEAVPARENVAVLERTRSSGLGRRTGGGDGFGQRD